jgi:2-oxoglutarate ferredoxin oxidoreductase subunit gamma
MAGFGGQGMLLAGKLLAQAAMAEGREVSWLPSYGPEMRGGTANVIVCLGDEPIGSPLIRHPRSLIVMNRPSLEKFGPMVQAGGVIVVNRTMIDVAVGRDDCTVVDVDSRAVAREAGNERAANLAMLGAWVGATEAVAPAALEAAIDAEFSGDKAKHAATNRATFRAGFALGRTVGVTP